MRREVLAFLIDLVVPVAGYYTLRGLGLGEVPSLVLAAAPTAVFLCYQAIRRRRLDPLGAFVLVLLVVGVAVSFVSGDPRFLLAKAGWVTAVVALAFLGSLLTARPLTFTFTRALLSRTAMRDRVRTEAWDELWRSLPRFRRIWRASTVLWAVGLLTDAVLRVVMAYRLPVDTVPGLSAVLAAATFLVIQVAQHVYFTRAGLWRIARTAPVTSTAGA